MSERKRFISGWAKFGAASAGRVRLREVWPWDGRWMEERSLTVASPLRFALGIEVGAVVCHRTYRPAGFLAVKQEGPPNGGRIPFQAGNRRCLGVDPSFGNNILDNSAPKGVALGVRRERP